MITVAAIMILQNLALRIHTYSLFPKAAYHQKKNIYSYLNLD